MSIIQAEKKCFFTGRTDGLHEHHIFGGPWRKWSDKYGLTVYLRPEFHLADSPYRTPHNDKETDLMLKRIGQIAFEQEYGREKFMEIFGRNYLAEKYGKE
jgi:hypothetical protein